MADSSSSSTNTETDSAGRRNFLKIGAAGVGGLVVGGVVGYLAKGSTSTTTTMTESTTSTETMPGGTTTVTSTAPPVTSTATSTITSTQPPVTSTVTSTTTSTNTSQIASQQAELVAYSGIADALITLGVQEAAAVSAMAAAIIPTDSNGPGATEAGVIYFIDRQLWGEYGTNGRMYNKGPFIMPNTPGPLTVPSPLGPVTYSGGSPATTWAAGQTYGYGMSLRNFWRYGIAALETYAISTYGSTFETLSAANQVACLSDLFANKPTSFNSIIPSDFANEVFFMTWAGFLMDPMYGGNRGMVGWTLTASPGLNSGNFYGEGQTPQQRMVSPVPLLLKPASNAQFQQSLKIAGVLKP